ncbi:hypothetical protein QL285_034197 [Trifolium repens]|nr:hypothetical protein QL285_034197 [Trifolium repens]
MKKSKVPANTKTKKKRNSGNDEETKDSNVVRNNQFFNAVFHHGALYASGSDFDAHLYVEHNDSDDSDSDDNDSADSGDDAHGVHFSDSEDERTITLNDGFDPAPTQKALDNNLKMVLSHPPVKYSGPETKVDDHEYCSDELGSSDPDDSNEDSRPKNLKLRRSQLNKDFKFEIDMEFNTLNDFRFAIRHWNVLNRFTLDWVKNESYRRKPPKGKTTSTKANQGKANSSAAADQGKATSSAAAEGQLSHSPIEPLVNVSQSQVEEVIDASQSLFDEIPDEVIATIPEVNPDDIPKKAKVVRKRVVKGKAVNDKKEAPVRRRQSENRCWFNSGPTFSYNRC